MYVALAPGLLGALIVVAPLACLVVAVGIAFLLVSSVVLVVPYGAYRVARRARGHIHETIRATHAGRAMARQLDEIRELPEVASR